MMKQIKIFFVFWVCAFAASCSSKLLPKEKLEREWMLVSLQNIQKKEMIAQKAKIVLKQKNGENNFSGKAFMGCNEIIFTIKIKSNEVLEVSEVKSNSIICDNRHLEEIFLKNFYGKMTYSFDGHFLNSINNKGDVLRFVASDWD